MKTGYYVQFTNWNLQRKETIETQDPELLTHVTEL